MDSVSIINLVIGGIGALTGVASLVWLILKSRSKLIIEFFSYELIDFDSYDGNEARIYTEILVRNKNDKDNTVENVFVAVDDTLYEYNGVGRIFPMDIKGNSSKKLKINFFLSDEEYKKQKARKNFKYCVYLETTFGRIKRCKIVS